MVLRRLRKGPLTPRVIIAAIQKTGARLCKRVGPRCATYTLQPPGARVEPHHALKVIASGKVTPERDGLFGNSQSWRAP
jgi:hypothetical protein